MRTDIHRPSAIEPADYSYLGSFVMDPPCDPEGNMMVPEDMLATYPQEHLDGASFAELLHKAISPDRAYPVDGDPFSGYRFANREKCDHCGASLNYVAVYRHNPSNQCIAVGHDCADNTMSMDSRRALDAKRQRDLMAAGRQNAEKEAQRLEALMLVREAYPEAYAILDRYDGPNSFIADIASKVAKWGSLTDKQARAVVKAHARDLERAKAVEEGEVKEIPTGRFIVEGEVVKLDTKDTDFGVQYKMVVKHADGWAVYGTEPRGLDPEVGDRVRFTARVEAAKPKKGEPFSTFGFFSRPTKAELVEA